MTETELIEELAHFEHESWNRWMLWLYKNGVWNEKGYFCILPDKAERWQQLANTPYADLDEPTKQYDRDEVMHILPAINRYAGKEPTP